MASSEVNTHSLLAAPSWAALGTRSCDGGLRINIFARSCPGRLMQNRPATGLAHQHILAHSPVPGCSSGEPAPRRGISTFCSQPRPGRRLNPPLRRGGEHKNGLKSIFADGAQGSKDRFKGQGSKNNGQGTRLKGLEERFDATKAHVVAPYLGSSNDSCTGIHLRDCYRTGAAKNTVSLPCVFTFLVGL